ncbi:MAG: PorV/PorQ family protein [Candidatus Margulisiibacteriota bacterium]|nr:PorV/PorQ family protein [Candidatus Margulisiibacteriota bacterium]
MSEHRTCLPAGRISDYQNIRGNSSFQDLLAISFPNVIILPKGKLVNIRYIICSLMVLFVIAGSSFSATTSVDPLRIGVGARSLAMGRTNLVAPGDINAIFVNPANAAYIDGWGLTSMYTSLMDGDINYTLMGGGKKFDFGGMGVAYLSGGTTGISVTTRDANGRVVSAGTSFDYANSVIALSWGRMLRENIAGGAVLKSFSKGFTGGYSSGSGFDLDLGILFKPRPNLTAGIAIQNVLPTGISWNTGTNEDVPMLIKAGLTSRIKENILLAADADLSPFALHSGVEWQLNRMFVLRGGLDQVPSGSESALNLGVGVGIDFRRFKFDYAYYKDNTLDANSTHYFTLGFAAPQFGKKTKKNLDSARGNQARGKEVKKKLPPPPIKKVPEPTPKPRIKSVKEKKIEAYIDLLENKLRSAKKPARRVKLKSMIDQQKARLEQVTSNTP